MIIKLIKNIIIKIIKILNKPIKKIMIAVTDVISPVEKVEPWHSIQIRLFAGNICSDAPGLLLLK